MATSERSSDSTSAWGSSGHDLAKSMEESELHENIVGCGLLCGCLRRVGWPLLCADEFLLMPPKLRGKWALQVSSRVISLDFEGQNGGVRASVGLAEPPTCSPSRRNHLDSGKRIQLRRLVDSAPHNLHSYEELGQRIGTVRCAPTTLIPG